MQILSLNAEMSFDVQVFPKKTYVMQYPSSI